MSDAHAQPKPLIIQVRDLHKSFGDKPVLCGLNLDVRECERIAIIGPSGSGKSTLLRMLMTLEKPSAGEIIVDGDHLWQMPRNGVHVPANEAHIRQVRSRVGMVFQHFNLFPHMTVMGNVIEAPRRVLKMSKADAVARATELLESVGLGDKLEAHPAQLSGGQKQRVAIARALAMRPAVMLFDEVTSALDPELVGEVLNVLRDIAKRGETTMLLVTHQMNFAQEIATRVVFIDQGVVCEQGPPSKIFNEPEQQRTRDFLRAVLEAV